MKYMIKNGDNVIGITELELGDPPMGFVFGILEPTHFYTPDVDITGCRVYINETNEEVASKFITIEDHSEEFGEPCIEITILVRSAEVYEKFFKNHLEAYEKQFSQAVINK
ncbi:hypothetical protein [Pectobacterium versatile]|uniref:hypothetical protein n=1 Tax=Pectobacterium versatile TaxID=2488639 RepID=UPI00208E5004|nr:hypothetical protein [Pectobacterium versatile]MCO4311324.1 hypothetical protein [Pectobacterium versatile]